MESYYKLNRTKIIKIIVARLYLTNNSPPSTGPPRGRGRNPPAGASREAPLQELRLVHEECVPGEVHSDAKRARLRPGDLARREPLPGHAPAERGQTVESGHLHVLPDGGVRFAANVPNEAGRAADGTKLRYGAGQ